ncbi:MAG: hypothetical protein E7413_02125 [Ruminococcaceae bacterium]|nr:hypothetical protein [Oscillospiraceae bacterium]
MNNQQNKNKNKLKLILLVLLCILCVLLALFLGIVVGKNRQKTVTTAPAVNQNQTATNNADNAANAIPNESGKREISPSNTEPPSKDTATSVSDENNQGETAPADTGNQSEIDLSGEPVATLYQDGGKTYTVPLEEVSAYIEAGWRPLHKYLFEASFDDVQSHFGSLSLVSRHEGSADSGDIPTNDYSNSKNSLLHIPKISYWPQYMECVYLELKLKDAFPFLALYADSNGNLSAADVNEAFGNSGIYGPDYRVTDEANSAFGTFDHLNLRHGDDHYSFVYDDMFATISIDELGYININTSICSFCTIP